MAKNYIKQIVHSFESYCESSSESSMILIVMDIVYDGKWCLFPICMAWIILCSTKFVFISILEALPKLTMYHTVLPLMKTDCLDHNHALLQCHILLTKKVLTICFRAVQIFLNKWWELVFLNNVLLHKTLPWRNTCIALKYPWY